MLKHLVLKVLNLGEHAVATMLNIFYSHPA